MRTDIFFTRTTKPICNFANSGVCNKKEMKDFKCCIHFFQAFLAFALGKSPEGESIFNNKSWISHKILFACKPTCMNLHKIGSCHSHTYILYMHNSKSTCMNFIPVNPPPFRGSLPRKSLISRLDWVSCAGDINLPHTPFPPPNKKIKYNEILTYILRSIFLEIPHLELLR